MRTRKSGLYCESLGEPEKPSGELASMTVGAASKYQVVTTPGQALQRSPSSTTS